MARVVQNNIVKMKFYTGGLNIARHFDLNLPPIFSKIDLRIVNPGFYQFPGPYES